jgi:hypothetical protein
MVLKEKCTRKQYLGASGILTVEHGGEAMNKWAYACIDPVFRLFGPGSVHLLLEIMY